MPEQRRKVREEEITPPISCFAELPDGTAREGVMQDLSDTGARVSGDATGLSTGDRIRLVLVVLSDQKVVYEAEVKHVDPAGEFYGVAFTSGPHPMAADNAQDAKKTCCGHKQHTPFCAYCGRDLSVRQGATA